MRICYIIHLVAVELCLQFMLKELFSGQGSEQVDVSCASLSTTKGPVSRHPFPYSDHEALTAEFLFTPNKKKHERSERQVDGFPGICSFCLQILIYG